MNTSVNDYVEVVAVGEDGVRTEYRYGVSPEGGEVRTTVRAAGTGCAVTDTTVSYRDGATRATYLNGVLKATEVREPFAETAYEGPLGTASPRWTRTETDFLGRTIAETHPGFRVCPESMTNAANPRLVIDAHLAQGIPALSPPTGRTNLTGHRIPSFDMNVMKSNTWPRPANSAQGDGSLHSDIKNVAFFYNHRVFKKIIEEGGL